MIPKMRYCKPIDMNTQKKKHKDHKQVQTAITILKYILIKNFKNTINFWLSLKSIKN